MGRAFQNRKESMAKTAGQKTKVYSKYGKEIYMCAKNGGTDPDHNLSLRRMIEKAKKDQVPTHVIDRAIDKVNSSAGEDYAPSRYEGFGPGGTMIIVDCLTDNSNRTYTQIRQAFVKNGAKLGGPGAVSHMFDHQAVFAFKGDNEDEIFEMLMMEDIDVTDIENEEGMLSVFAPTTEFYKIKTALEAAIKDVVFEVEEITFVPQTMTDVSGEDIEVFEQFIEALNDCDDTQEVYHNAEIVK